MDRKRVIISLVIAVVLCACMANLWRPRSSIKVSAVETTTSLGIYWDSACSSAVEYIDWGVLTPGQNSKVTFYVRNEGNRACVLLASIVGWQGDNTSNCLSFNCETPRIAPSQAVQVTPSLLVFSNASEASFSFGILLMGVIVTFADFGAFFVNNQNVRMIYPSDSASKPLNCSAAMVSDWTASAFVSTKLVNVSEGLDTNSSFVNQTSGRPMGDAGAGIVSFGGPVVNPVIKYAESNTTSQSDRAPIKFRDGGSNLYFQFANGSSIAGATLPLSVINFGQDMFVIEIYMDGSGRYVLLCYGFGWKGTYAAGKYFDTVIYPNLASHTESWIIVKWQDANGDGFVNSPFDGDTYTIIAQGS